jgi:hydrogenase maturation protease
LARALVSAHTILEASGGEFVSLVDPPKLHRDAAQCCKNVGTWPVLVGDPGQRDTLLSSPIILYDYPEIAPESPGNLFDGAEIDEILSLRILTMTDDEKREMRQSDDRTRQILERTESLPEEHFAKLHGVLRGMRPSREDMP